METTEGPVMALRIFFFVVHSSPRMRALFVEEGRKSFHVAKK